MDRGTRGGKDAHFDRLEREDATLLVGRSITRAVYGLLISFARTLSSVGIHAHAVTLSSLLLATMAALAFGTNHYGWGAIFGVVSALADAIDGIVAREQGTSGAFGKMLDTIVDRYVEALLFIGIAVSVRDDVFLLLLALFALVASFMVSYVSSVLRELGVREGSTSMRRGDRLICLLGGAVLVPFMPSSVDYVRLAPILGALSLIAVIGNVSAIRRLLAYGRSTPSSSGKTNPPLGFPVHLDGR